MRTKTAIIVACAALTLSASVAEARYRGDRGFRNRRVVVEQPSVGVGLSLAGVLLLGQLMNQQPTLQAQEQFYEPLPAPRRRPVPLK